MVGMDMMENIANEVEEMGKYGYQPKRELKQKSNAFNKCSSDFNSQLKKELGFDHQAEKFGDTAQFLHELFEICIFVKPEDRIKVLSMAKMMVKSDRSNIDSTENKD